MFNPNFILFADSTSLLQSISLMMAFLHGLCFFCSSLLCFIVFLVFRSPSRRLPSGFPTLCLIIQAPYPFFSRSSSFHSSYTVSSRLLLSRLSPVMKVSLFFVLPLTQLFLLLYSFLKRDKEFIDVLLYTIAFQPIMALLFPSSQMGARLTITNLYIDIYRSMNIPSIRALLFRAQSCAISTCS